MVVTARSFSRQGRERSMWCARNEDIMASVYGRWVVRRVEDMHFEAKKGAGKGGCRGDPAVFRRPRGSS
jgi:hypothetical protein